MVGCIRCRIADKKQPKRRNKKAQGALFCLHLNGFLTGAVCAEFRDEWADLQNEARLIKKVRLVLRASVPSGSTFDFDWLPFR